jgi:hypothetical protein
MTLQNMASAGHPAVPHGMTNHTEEPLYVNSKQFNRILKRREARARFQQLAQRKDKTKTVF